MKHYCIFSAQFFPHVGGVERYTLYLSRKLIEAGNKVTIVTSNTGSSKSIEQMNGIWIYRLPCYDLLGGRYPVFKKNGEFKNVKKEFESKQYDFVIINTRFYLHSLYGAKFAKKNRIPAIVIEHGTSHLSVNNPFFDKAGAIYEHLLTYFLKKYCKDYYGVSEACCEWSGHFNIKSKGTLYNAVEIEEFESLLEEKKYDYRMEYSIPQHADVIAFTGRLIPEKGILPLIRAVKKINQSIAVQGEKEGMLYLLIAGDGPLFQVIKEENQEDAHIILLGQIDFTHIVNLLRVSDVFCLPSDSEGFPTSVLEAVACHCFVITTYQGGARELILDDSYGFIMKDNREQLIEENIRKAFLNADERENAAEKSYQRLKKYFTWNATAQKVQEIAEQMNGVIE